MGIMRTRRRRGTLAAVELDVSPQPPDEVHDAIAAALRVVRQDDDANAWWRAGLHEAVAGEDE